MVLTDELKSPPQGPAPITGEPCDARPDGSTGDEGVSISAGSFWMSTDCVPPSLMPLLPNTHTRCPLQHRWR